MIRSLPPRRPRGDRPRTGPPRLLPDSVMPAVPFSEEQVALAQAAFYLLTGVWPLLSMASFELVTGDKKDEWLVKTVGALIACTGGVLALSARRGTIGPEVRSLALGNALTLAAADLIFVAQKRIRKVYLLDAAAELAIAGAWAVATRNEKQGVRL